MTTAIFGTASSRGYSAAAALQPPGPDRFTVITVEYIAYNWWMVTWKGNVVVCGIEADHEGMPTGSEIFRDCGEVLYEEWVNQDPCLTPYNSHNCPGYYMYFVDSHPAEKEIGMQLAPAVAYIALEDCQHVISTATNICETAPTIVITGEEPLPNETIIRIEGTYNGQPFMCDGADTCKFQVGETVEDGVLLEFWAFSSYGDSSLPFTAQVRVRQADEGDPDQLYWYVDVLSTQWRGPAVATCSDSWQAFPPVGGASRWLTTPTQSEELSSDIPYTYLAANLILQGVVDARACPDAGISADGTANQCGLEQARDAVNIWQNQFDELILSTAKETGVPAHLLKNLFARESQFWPGVFRGLDDVGLGQLTEDGADATLLWSPSFYNQFCPLVLSAEACGKGYLHIKEEERLLLRQSLVRSVNATCTDCPLGLDLTQADFSVTVFAHTLIANCEQTGRVVRNYTGGDPGQFVSYEDMWKFTLVNYNAGPGCLADAISGAQFNGLPLTWENISPYLPPACILAIDYVNDISQ
ncbi:MAG: hypothetical protein AB1649_11680 [Chloroflexota bacterium]